MQIKNKIFLIGLLCILSACAGLQFPQLPFDWRSVLGRLNDDLKTHQVFIGDPVFIRIFKEENILELWMKGADNFRYTLVKTYPICRWSGALGPKFFEGDHQAPEGFYETTLAQLKPDSQYHLSFNIGFPNAFDRVNERTGTFIMIHGECVSQGCYAMTNPAIEEIYTLIERALEAGQPAVPIHIFPFRMTSKRILSEFNSPHYDFWANIRDGYDYFEQFGVPPKWIVNNKSYDFY